VVNKDTDDVTAVLDRPKVNLNDENSSRELRQRRVLRLIGHLISISQSCTSPRAQVHHSRATPSFVDPSTAAKWRIGINNRKFPKRERRLY